MIVIRSSMNDGLSLIIDEINFCDKVTAASLVAILFWTRSDTRESSSIFDCWLPIVGHRSSMTDDRWPMIDDHDRSLLYDNRWLNDHWSMVTIIGLSSMINVRSSMIDQLSYHRSMIINHRLSYNLCCSQKLVKKRIVQIPNHFETILEHFWDWQEEICRRRHRG